MNRAAELPNRRYEGFVDAGRMYVDRYTLAKILNRPVGTIRLHCPPAIVRTNESGRVIRTYYDALSCGEILDEVPQRCAAVVDQGPPAIADLPTSTTVPAGRRTGHG